MLDDIMLKETGRFIYIPNARGWAGWKQEPF